MKRVDMFPDGINKRARDENNRKTKRKRKQKNKKIVLKVLGSVTIRPFHHLMADISKKELLHSKLKSFFFSFSSFLKTNRRRIFRCLDGEKKERNQTTTMDAIVVAVVLNHLGGCLLLAFGGHR
jgi:hypothetical protein